MGCNDNCADFSRGNKGDPGVSSLVYIGYANDANGDGFSLVSSPALPFISFVILQTPPPTLTVANFPKPFLQYIGTPGTPGVFGGNSDSFIFNSTTGGDPTSGKLLFNNANLSAATQINISNTDSNEVDVTNWLAAMNTSNAAVQGFLKICEEDDSTKFALYALTVTYSGSRYSELTVTFLAASSDSPFENGDTLVFSYTISGKNGINGTDGIAILFNALSTDGINPNSGDTGGITTVFESQNIPANTLVNNGDQVAGQIAVQCLSTVFTTLPQVMTVIGGNLFGFDSFSQNNQVYVIDYTIDRISSSSYLLTKRTIDSVGNCRGWSQIYTGVSFTVPIQVAVQANTNGNVGGIVCLKNYAEYKQN